MSWRDIRPVAVGVARRDDEILLSRLRDEQADKTLVREFREELSVEVAECDLLDTLENTFTFQGEEGHEIWFLYEVAFAEDWPYERDEFEIHETEHGHDETVPAEWVRIARLSEVTVYPEDLATLV